MESRPDLQQRGNAAADARLACSWFGDSAQDLQQRAFPRSVAADDSNNLAGLHGERDILQCPEFRALAGELATFSRPYVAKTRKKLLRLLTQGPGIELP